MRKLIVCGFVLLLLATASVSGCLLPQLLERQRILTEVLRLGGEVTVDEDGTLLSSPPTLVKCAALRVRAVNISSPYLSSKHINDLSVFHENKILWIVNTPIGDESIDQLGRLKGLEELNIAGTRVSAAGVGHLRDLLPNTRLHTQHYRGG